MLLPGGVLMLAVIVVPLLVGFFIAMLDLDQYTLRQWFSAPFVGFANFTEAFTNSPLLHSIWISVSLVGARHGGDRADRGRRRDLDAEPVPAVAGSSARST